MQQAWIESLIGGGLIGLAASVFLLFSGRIAGVSGICFGVIKPKSGDFVWRFMFVIGLVLAGVAASIFMDDPFVNESGRSMAVIGLAGLIVGFGTRLGSGCTSGHGVCGLSRLSPRSLAATLTFIAVGVAAATLFRTMIGG